MSDGPIVVMKRYELKYILNRQQTEFFKEALQGHMALDQYGRTSIASLYYDTPDYRLIRTSVEKPPF
ncbi:MAG: VTC domain-containing protein, partial [Oscillospiraceae bacterium]|nr:VTC domain-containing protein [Oscillospiraceae bacterium]